MSLLVSAVVSLAPSAKRISEPCRLLRCSLPRFWRGFSAATPTKHLCYRLRGGLCLVFGHSYAAKRISESCRPLRCSLPRFWSGFSAATPMWTPSGALPCIVMGGLPVCTVVRLAFMSINPAQRPAIKTMSGGGECSGHWDVCL